MWRASKTKNRDVWIFVGADELQAGIRAADSWSENSFYVLPVGRDSTNPAAANIALLFSDPEWTALCQPAQKLIAIVSDHWLAATSIPWSTEQLDPDSARRDATAHLLAAGFEVDANGEVRLEEAGYGEPRLALGFPEAILAAIETGARSVGIRRVEVRSLAVEIALRLNKPVSERLVVLEPQSGQHRRLTLARMDSVTGRVSEIFCRSERLDRLAPSSHGLFENMVRLGWSDRNEPPATITIVEGEPLRIEVPRNFANDIPPLTFVDWVTELPAAEKSLPHSWLRWLGSARRIPGVLDVARRSISGGAAAPPFVSERLGPSLTTIHVVAMLAIFAALAWVLTDAATARRETMALRATAPTAAIANPTPAALFTKEKSGRVQAINAAISQLNIPFAGILRAVQPPKDIRAALLGMEVDIGVSDSSQAEGRRTSLKLLAEAPTADDMTLYVAYLAGRPSLASAKLVKHETRPDRTYRFAVEIVWEP